jgi:hypothetical protein
VPGALGRDATAKAARRRTVFAAGEAAQLLPSREQTASTWLDHLQRGEIPVRVTLADTERMATRLEPSTGCGSWTSFRRNRVVINDTTRTLKWLRETLRER